MFNFKFKLILRKKKIYVNCFFLNFQLPMLVESVEPVLPVESVEEIILKNPPKSPFKKGGLSVDSFQGFPPFCKGGSKGGFCPCLRGPGFRISTFGGFRNDGNKKRRGLSPPYSVPSP
jgi:hypothetical protein